MKNQFFYYLSLLQDKLICFLVETIFIITVLPKLISKIILQRPKVCKIQN